MGGRHATRPQKKARDLPFADTQQGERYALVKAMLGCGRARVEDSAGIERVCKVKGSLYKRDYVRVHDLVLISLREFETSSAKGDIVWRYTDDEARMLKKYGELAGWSACQGDEGAGGAVEDDLVSFEDDVDAI